jgi:hypothetical protein
VRKQKKGYVNFGRFRKPDLYAILQSCLKDNLWGVSKLVGIDGW